MNIEPIKLLSGSHADTGSTGQGCFMNVIAYLNGESQITDQSPCVCVTIKPIAIFLNDFANESQRQRLLPYVLRAMGTATDDKAVIENRLVAVVQFAEFNAQLSAKYVKYAAEYAAEYTAEYAAEYAAKYAEYAAKYAKYAAEYTAEYAAEYAAIKDAIFDAGIKFLEAVCNPPMVANQTIINHANELIQLAAI